MLFFLSKTKHFKDQTKQCHSEPTKKTLSIQKMFHLCILNLLQSFTWIYFMFNRQCARKVSNTLFYHAYYKFLSILVILTIKTNCPFNMIPTVCVEHSHGNTRTLALLSCLPLSLEKDSSLLNLRPSTDGTVCPGGELNCQCHFPLSSELFVSLSPWHLKAHTVPYNMLNTK